MLDKRTNVLFEKKVFNQLVSLAKKRRMSVGNLVRQAVVKVYMSVDLRKQTSRQKAFRNIVKLRKKIKSISDSEIKEFINYGRR